MRLWSIHPQYLDAKGLLALWREALLAKHVLEGSTKGYKNHPQLIRFKETDNPIGFISFGYHGKLGEIADTMPLSVDVSLWLFYPQTGIKSSLVISIDSSGKDIFWKSIELKDSVVNANLWEEINATFELPKTINGDENLKIYVWSIDKRSFYMDDLNLKFRTK